MKKLGTMTISILSGLTLSLLSACGTQDLASYDILERSQETASLTWGVKADTPLFGSMNIETRQIEGFEIDLAAAITREILGDDAKVEFIEVSSKTRIPLLKNGNIDAIIATMTITEARREVVDFSEVYFEAGQSLLVHKDSGIASIEDLDKSSVVIGAKGSNSVANIRELIPGITVLELENFSEAFVALRARQGVAVTTDNSVLYGLSAQDPDYIVTDETFTVEPYGIAVNKNQERFLNEVNKALQTIKENGTYDSLHEKWLGSVINRND